MSANIQQVNWVEKRAECLLPDVFRQLREIVNRDVQEANRLSPLLEKGFRFEIKNGKSNGQFKVHRVPDKGSIFPPLSVTFTLNHDSIRVDCELHPDYDNGFFQVYSTWQFSEGYCRLTIDDKPYEVWQISHHALEHLVFRHPLDKG